MGLFSSHPSEPQDPPVALATRWRTPVGIAMAVVLIMAALILALLLSGAENGQGMQRSTSASTATTTASMCEMSRDPATRTAT
jgi:hypothetical protein